MEQAVGSFLSSPLICSLWQSPTLPWVMFRHGKRVAAPHVPTDNGGLNSGYSSPHRGVEHHYAVMNSSDIVSVIHPASALSAASTSLLLDCFRSQRSSGILSVEARIRVCRRNVAITRRESIHFSIWFPWPRGQCSRCRVNLYRWPSWPRGSCRSLQDWPTIFLMNSFCLFLIFG